MAQNANPERGNRAVIWTGIGIAAFGVLAFSMPEGLISSGLAHGLHEWFPHVQLLTNFDHIVNQHPLEWRSAGGTAMVGGLTIASAGSRMRRR